MSNTSEQIRDLLVSKLEAMEVATDVKTFPEVYGYGQGDFGKYPVAVVRPTGGRGVFLDTNRNERIFSFEISLYQESSQAGQDKEKANEVMIKSCDQLIQAFDQDRDLSGEIEIVKVVDFDYDFKVSAGTYVYARFRVECLVIVPNY